MDLPKRKSPRSPGYNYASVNFYFITICTKKKKCIFGQPGVLNWLGKCAEDNLHMISKIYPDIRIDKYVIMPNHIHVIFDIQEGKTDLAVAIGQYKMSVTKEMHTIGYPNAVWQRSFHDHIIRNEKSYQDIWKYIDNNPLQWELDCFYQKADLEDRWEGHCPSPTMDGKKQGR